MIRVGTAGWSLRKEHQARFPAGSSHLERYAQKFNAVEINTSFYRNHRPTTYARWAASTPNGFCFSVKIPRTLTHLHRLKDASPLEEFLNGVRELGDKLGPLLVQLPPSLPFQSERAVRFFESLRKQFDGWVVCEPRHTSWFEPEAERLLHRFHIARAAADPAIVPAAAQPAGWLDFRYYRLHGSPVMYSSAYSSKQLDLLEKILKNQSQEVEEVWCIFDNTAKGAATENALYLLGQI